ncbi:MAG: hypothetical protein IJF75_06810 [Clostridia bacterium]|nr:hypothetical protein [Clostridia bacterium]
MPGTVKIKFYDKGFFDGETVDLKERKENKKVALYVDKTIKSESKEKKSVKKEKLSTEKSEKSVAKKEDKIQENVNIPKPIKQVEKFPKNGQPFVRERADLEAGESQMDMFSELGVEKKNYKFAKKTAKKFFEDATEFYEYFKAQKNKISFNRAEMLKSVNEYLQALFIAVELSKGENANENNLQFALEISWFGNLFDRAKSLFALSQSAKTKLMEVPQIFMVTVVLDVREKTSRTKILFDGLKKTFSAVYPNDTLQFELLTKPIIAFLEKQNISV